MLNKKEKNYFINNILSNYKKYPHNPKLQYILNTDIVRMFKELGYITEHIYLNLVALIYEGAYEKEYSPILKTIDILKKELGAE